jgi:hypothetical protein
MRKGMPVVAIVAATLLWGGAGQAVAPERAAAATAAACQRQSSSVYVELSRNRYPETTDHFSDSIGAGQPALLHIDRENADLHRDQSLENYPPRTGYDRDEYPPAMSREGGYGADIRYIDPSDNRGAGSVMGNALEDYCEDQPFRIRFIP